MYHNRTGYDPPHPHPRHPQSASQANPYIPGLGAWRSHNFLHSNPFDPYIQTATFSDAHVRNSQRFVLDTYLHRLCFHMYGLQNTPTKIHQSKYTNRRIYLCPSLPPFLPPSLYPSGTKSLKQSTGSDVPVCGFDGGFSV